MPIISKNLDGVVTGWNKSAGRMFGYRAEKAIGQHITLIIPLDRRDEEEMLGRLRRGERVRHFGGGLQIQFEGTGTRVSITFPLVITANSQKTEYRHEAQAAG